MSRLVDDLIAYRVLHMLVTPFDQTAAYKLGIIDKRGNELIPSSKLNTVQEREAYTLLNKLVFRIKKIIEKVPIDNKRLLSIAAAYSLIRECNESGKEPIDLELRYINKLKSNLDEETKIVDKYLNETKIITFRQFTEEAPANSSGGVGAPAGLPGDESGTVVVKRKSKLFRRKQWV